MPAFATIADLESRFPNDLALVAADEQTGVRDDVRIGLGLDDATTEIRAILAARYSAADLAALDESSLAVVKVYCIDIAFYRIALAFSRSTENIKERYDQAIKRLEAIASGKGALTTTNTGAGSSPADTAGDVGQNEVIVEAPERVFTRERLGRI
ncbi:gp436 family protein [Rhizobium sp. BK377]|uniref:gp436 family protein n=1 Tax=Rhizobium sp. BK377 TaxID=2587058 RepID=UPI00161D0313|nr:phage protein Gp36 family protein [Rhizobium sp. BK377]MBB3461982.1 phage gp36-like protein [Rhizobium sp. BK377]